MRGVGWVGLDGFAGDRDAGRKGPGFEDDVAAMNKGEEFREGGVREELGHCKGVGVGFKPDMEARTREVLGVEVGFDKEFDAPSGGTGPVGVVQLYRPRALANFLLGRRDQLLLLLGRLGEIKVILLLTRQIL